MNKPPRQPKPPTEDVSDQMVIDRLLARVDRLQCKLSAIDDSLARAMEPPPPTDRPPLPDYWNAAVRNSAWCNNSRNSVQTYTLPEPTRWGRIITIGAAIAGMAAYLIA